MELYDVKFPKCTPAQEKAGSIVERPKPKSKEHASALRDAGACLKNGTLFRFIDLSKRSKSLSDLEKKRREINKNYVPKPISEPEAASEPEKKEGMSLGMKIGLAIAGLVALVGLIALATFIINKFKGGPKGPDASGGGGGGGKVDDVNLEDMVCEDSGTMDQLVDDKDIVDSRPVGAADDWDDVTDPDITNPEIPVFVGEIINPATPGLADMMKRSAVRGYSSLLVRHGQAMSVASQSRALNPEKPAPISGRDLVKVGASIAAAGVLWCVSRGNGTVSQTARGLVTVAR